MFTARMTEDPATGSATAAAAALLAELQGGADLDRRPMAWRREALLSRSLPHSASVASLLITPSLLITHRVLGTWRRSVDILIAVSDFTRSRYVAAGFAPDRVIVKPNIVKGTRTLAMAHHRRAGGFLRSTVGAKLVAKRAARDAGLGDTEWISNIKLGTPARRRHCRPGLSAAPPSL